MVGGLFQEMDRCDRQDGTMLVHGIFGSWLMALVVHGSRLMVIYGQLMVHGSRLMVRGQLMVHGNDG